MKKILNLIALSLVSTLLVGCFRDGRDGKDLTGSGTAPSISVTPGGVTNNTTANNPANGNGVGIASNDLILKDLAGGKFLTITSQGISGDTGAAGVGNAGAVAGQALSAVNDKVKFQADAAGLQFVRVWSSKHQLRDAGGNVAADPTVSGAGAAIAGAFTMLDGLLGGTLFINAKGAGGGGTGDAVFTNAVTGSTAITFLTREVLPNGTIRGRCEAQAAEVDNFSAATVDQRAPAKVPCLYTIN